MRIESLSTPIILFLLLFPAVLFAQTKKSAEAFLTNEPVFIDGNLEEDSWNRAIPATDFLQFEPYNGKTPSQETEVFILYNDQGIYIGAKLYDNEPDSILTQLGSRDDDNLNADFFGISVSPYQDGLNKWIFLVYANNVQYDAKGTNNGDDENWNAAWESATSITEQGWFAEIFIPYSMLRFPRKDAQTWDINFFRSIRRHRELSTWNFIDNNIEGDIVQSGVLTGIKNISPPLRLSLSPYVSGYLEKQPGTDISTYLNYGADLKYGINESFTLDMTLIPDFGQVESDDEIYNLTPFEVQYDEKRQFFTEGTELFDKGDVFYTRRIGTTPGGFYHVEDHLGQGERVIANPSEAPVINATKISGRTSKGTGLGVFNAMTARTEATIEDSLGNTRTVTTQPFTNYNMIVADQNILANSRVGIFNTNVFKGRNEQMANLTGADWEFKNASNSYSFLGNFKVSNKINPEKENESGISYYLETSKRSGTFRYDAGTWSQDDKYDPNDMGILNNNNENGYYASLYHLVLNPKGIILNSRAMLASTYVHRQNDKKFQWWDVKLMYHSTFKNHLSAGAMIVFLPVGNNDFYEPRTEGFFFHSPFAHESSFWLSPDYRKPFVVDVRLTYFDMPSRDNNMYKVSLEPRYRISDKAFLTTEITARQENNQMGYVANSGSEVFFGSRDLTTYETEVSFKYIFNANSGLKLKARHYLIYGLYDSFYNLEIKDGTLSPSEYTGDHDFSFNAFTIDLSYNWYFAPASSLSIVWKNAVYSNGNGDTTSYFSNLKNTLEAEATNSLSVKVLYYIDYVKVRSLFRK